MSEIFERWCAGRIRFVTFEDRNLAPVFRQSLIGNDFIHFQAQFSWGEKLEREDWIELWRDFAIRKGANFHETDSKEIFWGGIMFIAHSAAPTASCNWGGLTKSPPLSGASKEKVEDWFSEVIVTSSAEDWAERLARDEDLRHDVRALYEAYRIYCHNEHAVPLIYRSWRREWQGLANEHLFYHLQDRYVYGRFLVNMPTPDAGYSSATQLEYGISSPDSYLSSWIANLVVLPETLTQIGDPFEPRFYLSSEIYQSYCDYVRVINSAETLPLNAFSKRWATWAYDNGLRPRRGNIGRQWGVFRLISK